MKRLISVIMMFVMWASFAHAEIAPTQEIVSDNGIRTWFIQDHYLPIITVDIAFRRSGFAYDSSEKSGLAFLVTSLLDEGAGEYSAQQYKETLEDHAISISVSLDEDNIYVRLKTLTPNLHTALGLLQAILLEPHFEPKATARVKKQIMVLLDKRKEDPDYIAGRALKNIIYADHPYQKEKYGSKESIMNITKDDLHQFARQNFTKENMTIAIAGDLKQGDIGMILERYFGQLPDKHQPSLVIPMLDVSGVAQSIKIDQPFDQNVVVFAKQGIARADPEFYPAYIANHILGGSGLESRLMIKVREENGLVYSIYSYLNTLEYANILAGGFATRSENVDQAIALVKQEFSNVNAGGVEQQALIDAKQYLVYSFPLRMTKNANLSGFLLSMQLNDLGQDFLQKRNGYVEAVNKESVDQIAKKLFDPNELTFVVVGKQQKENVIPPPPTHPTE